MGYWDKPDPRYDDPRTASSGGIIATIVTIAALTAGYWEFDEATLVDAAMLTVVCVFAGSFLRGFLSMRFFRRSRRRHFR